MSSSPPNDAPAEAFAAGVAHDLRNCVNTLQLAVEALIHFVPANAGDAADASVGRVRRGFRQMNGLLSDLLDRASLDAGRLALDLGRELLAQVVSESVGLVAPLAQQKKIALEPDVPADVALTCDADRLRRVLVNLLTNAVKFTPQGGVVRVRVHRADDRTTVIEVQDSGPGISPEMFDHLFERHWKGAKSKGAGLGLSIVKDLVEAHGGTITAGNAAAGGAQFRITLPSG